MVQSYYSRSLRIIPLDVHVSYHWFTFLSIQVVFLVWQKAVASVAPIEELTRRTRSQQRMEAVGKSLSTPQAKSHPTATNHHCPMPHWSLWLSAVHHSVWWPSVESIGGLRTHSHSIEHPKLRLGRLVILLLYCVLMLCAILFIVCVKRYVLCWCWFVLIC